MPLSIIFQLYHGRTDLDAQELGGEKNQYETHAKSQKLVTNIFMMKIELNFKWS